VGGVFPDAETGVTGAGVCTEGIGRNGVAVEPGWTFLSVLPSIIPGDWGSRNGAVSGAEVVERSGEGAFGDGKGPLLPERMPKS
jgi:hypothetical protein